MILRKLLADFSTECVKVLVVFSLFFSLKKNKSLFLADVDENGNRVIDKKGNEIWIEQSNRLHSFNNQHPLIYAIARDVTEGIQNENLILQNEEKYRGIIQNSRLGLLEVDLAENIQYANKAFCEISGYT